MRRFLCFICVFIVPSIIVLSGCGKGLDDGTPLAETREGDLTFRLELGRRYYYNGEEVGMRYTVTNVGDETARLYFANVQQFGYQVYDGDGVVDWNPKICQPMPSILEIQPDQSELFQADWSQVDYTGNPVAGGIYHLQAFLLDDNGGELLLDFEILD